MSPQVIGIDLLTDAQVDRFFRATEPSGACVEWRGEVDRDGYGRFTSRHGGLGRKRWMAHRVTYELMVGPIPEGRQVDHTCRNRACVLPDHLEAVTPKENHDRWTSAITACPQGHPYDEANTRGGTAVRGRTCRTCDREAARRRRAEDPERSREASRRYRERRRAA